MNMKRGTTAFGILLGVILAALGALVMIIGFWKTLVLAILFALGYFLGTVENKREFVKNAANKLIPEKDTKVIDFKSEVAKEQEQAQAAAEEAAVETVETVNDLTAEEPEDESENKE